MDEESDAPQMSDETVEWPDWSGYLQRAWQTLREDRFYGAMGGVGRIYYSAISRYAEDYKYDIEPFATFILAMDNEYVAWVAKKQADETTQE